MTPFSLNDIRRILTDQTRETTEALAQKAARLTRQYFGRAVALYAPLYISNYCSSYCTYCGFHSHNRLKRLKLTPDEIRAEAQRIAQAGIEDILLLTGESYTATPLSYLIEAVELCKPFSSSLSLEIHPLEENEYRALFEAGADGLTVYQETYDRNRYAQVHLAGKKKDYDFRYHTPERAARSGMRKISMGILLGLSEIASDLYALFEHLRWMERHFPGVEYSLSFPRLRTIKGQDFTEHHVDDVTFVKIICLARILFPRAGINLSTRESPQLRDHALDIGITRISAGSSTVVGGYALNNTQQDPQFDIADTRSVTEMIHLLKTRHFDPVLTDWRRIENEAPHV